MTKFAKIFINFFIIIAGFYFSACSSGEYEIEQYEVNYVETTIKVDTLRKISGNDNLKIDKNNLKNTQYKFSVQVGAFSTPTYFENFFSKAKQVLGNDVYFEIQNNLYKIRLGSFDTRLDAVKVVDLARSKGYTDAFIIIKKR